MHLQAWRFRLRATVTGRAGDSNPTATRARTSPDAIRKAFFSQPARSKIPPLFRLLQSTVGVFSLKITAACKISGIRISCSVFTRKAATISHRQVLSHSVFSGRFPVFGEYPMCISRFVRQICAVVTLAVVASSVANARAQDEKGGQPPQQGGRGDRQGGRGGFGGFGGFGNRGPGGGGMTFRVDRAVLLGLDQVRTELKVEESQAAVIDSALDAYREERNSAPRPDRDAFANMSEEERTKMFEDMQKQREELSRKTDEVLNALLEPAQITRLDQISLQMRLNGGLAAALKSDDLKAKLKISEEQIAKLDAAEASAREEMQKMMEEMRASFQGGRGQGEPGAPGAGGPAAGFEAMREKMEAARKKTSDSAMAVLTDAQKTQLEELKGAAFEIDMRAMMGGRGGFGGPGGPGGPGGRPPGAPGGDGGRGQGGRPRGTRPQTE